MAEDSARRSTDAIARQAAQVRSLEQLAALLRALRRRHARTHRDGELTYRQLAERTGWSQTSIAEYFTARTVPPVERFDGLLMVLGVSPAEHGALATARDRVEEQRHRDAVAAAAAASSASGPTGEGSHPPPAVVVPRQLPPAVRHFGGRRAALAELGALLGDPPATGTVVITAIAGMAGVGKTALAVHWAHQVAGHFPDGQLYVNLRGFDPSGPVVEPAEALRRFLDALGIPADRIPAGLDAQAAVYRTAVAGRRMLILLDNARDSAHVRQLLPGTPSCLVLVTSRNQLAGLVAVDAAQHVNVDVLAPDEAYDVLASRLGNDRVAAEPGAVAEIVEYCAGLPLALAIVAARAATHRGFALADLAQELRSPTGLHSHRLDALTSLDEPDTDVRAVFSWSYRALRPPAARLFRLLGLHPGPDVTVPAAASLAAVPVPQTRKLVEELIGAGLLQEVAPGRYIRHDLLRAYGTELAGTEPEPERHAAVGRLLDHYLHTADAADLLLRPTRDPFTPLPCGAGVSVVAPGDRHAAMDWFIAERPGLLAAVDLAVAGGFDVHTWQLAQVIATFLERLRHWLDQTIVQLAALPAARRLGDGRAEAFARRLLARAYVELGRHDDARAELGLAMELEVRAGDRAGQGHTHHYLAYVGEAQGRYDEALDHTWQALALYRAAGHRPGEASALNALGWFHALLGDYERAVVLCEQALALLRELSNWLGQSATLNSLGYAHHHLGRYSLAIACFRQSLALVRNGGDRYAEAVCLHHLGDCMREAGDADAARGVWQQAQAILTELDHPDAEVVRAKLAGHAADRSPRPS